ncbi:hypothetical protein CR513_34300, partial [Mucuna pruriens]
MRTIPKNGVTTWELCEKALLNNYYPPLKTNEMRRKLLISTKKTIGFFPRLGRDFEYYYLHVPTIGLINGFKMTLHSIVGEAFMDKPLEEGIVII